jgi:3-hydroxymyristoyl/3-hydroxydecanoyl-(acyl carrier protein) dehydratase
MPWIEPVVVAFELGTNTVRSQLDMNALTSLDLSFHHPGMIRFPGVCGIEEARQTLPGFSPIFPEFKKFYPKIVSLREVVFPGRISPAIVRATCVLFSLENVNAASFTIKAITANGERLATEGTMEFILVETASPQPPPGFKLVHRQIGFNTKTRTVQAEYDYTGKEILDLSELTHLPETLAVEAMVQGAIQIRQGKPEYANKLFWFTGIETAEFLQPIPRRGMLDLLATVEIEEKGGRAHCQALYAGKLVASATITFAITRGKAAA